MENNHTIEIYINGASSAQLAALAMAMRWRWEELFTQKEFSGVASPQKRLGGECKIDKLHMPAEMYEYIKIRAKRDSITADEALRLCLQEALFRVSGMYIPVYFDPASRDDRALSKLIIEIE